MSSGPSRSRSVVALLADIPTTGHLGEAQAQRFPLEGTAHGDRHSAFIDFAQYYVERGYKVVALYPKWRADDAERAIQFARGASRSDSIAAVPVNVSPLALSLLADQMTYLSPYLPSGIIAGLPQELPRHVLAGAWLRSVNNLDAIPISLKQHMGSYTPKAHFLAFCAPEPRVGRVKKMDATPNMFFRPVDPVQMLFSAGEGQDLAVFTEHLVPHIRAVSTQQLAPQPLGKDYWGSQKYVEFVAFSAHPEALTAPVRGLRPFTCAWCREFVLGDYCAFCGAANQVSAGKPPGYDKASNVPPPINTQPHDREGGPAAAAMARYQRQAPAPEQPSDAGPTAAPPPAPGNQHGGHAAPPAPSPAGPPAPPTPPHAAAPAPPAGQAGPARPGAAQAPAGTQWPSQ